MQKHMKRQTVKSLDRNCLFKNEDIFTEKRICGNFNLKLVICVLIPEFWNGCNQCLNSEVIQKI
jgi:hypothetical protein